MATVEQYKNYTDSVIAAIGQKASPRVKQAFPILIQKLHEAVIETGLTVEEWLACCDLLIEAGKVSSDKRNEMVLVTDVLGVESLVDMMEHARYAKEGLPATSSAILGPFYRSGVPPQPNGTSIIRKEEPGAPFTHLFGVVKDENGKPIKGATVDIWHDAPDGFYDSQSPDKPEYHCRGRFETDEDGRYATICLKPVPYPIPFDHAAGKLLTMMDRHPFRPAHIHFYVSAPGKKTLITQVFDRESDYLKDDSVFAVKEDLILDFKPVSAPLPNGGKFDEKIQYELEYDITLMNIDAVDSSKYQG
ncbi:aromatic compound dioxygenase [Meredithblackwellia eburnea MCA 4105]